ncbi:Smr domain-containing protein [Haematococcus lacustris]|uniref:Smr domain-containing protein n=1 Tax=Haematococcus lacustris TaxID=44745 RepID=A0A699ZAW6_HAELA|nr:Smr domain-containing protein [Haematococcus lacustris]
MTSNPTTVFIGVDHYKSVLSVCPTTYTIATQGYNLEFACTKTMCHQAYVVYQAACTFASNNAGRSDTEVDLHGLSVAEAQAKVEQVISSARRQAQGRGQPEPITFIVGQGRHSQGGEAKLKPAIASLITRHNLRCTVGHPNSGCLYVEFVTAEERGWFHRLMDKCVIS